MKDNEVEDDPKKNESEMEHTLLVENWDVHLIRSTVENVRKQQEPTQAIKKNQV
ncbi:36936_t:CDS:2, partial [Gigaspora margarita]